MIGHLFYAEDAVPEAWIKSGACLQEQVGQFLERRVKAVIERLVDVAEFPGKLGAVFHVGQQKVDRALQVTGGFTVIANGFAGFAQLELAKATFREELFNDLATVLLECCAAGDLSLEAGMQEVTVAWREFIE